MLKISEYKVNKFHNGLLFVDHNIGIPNILICKNSLKSQLLAQMFTKYIIINVGTYYNICK